MATAPGTTKDSEPKTGATGKLSNLFGGKKNPIVSTGRGGAGNIGTSTSTSAPTTAELTTPTIKQSTYTTGRGGTGNMALNDPTVPAHAEMARASQDVGAPAVRQSGEEGQTVMHWGRGGAANAMKVEREQPKIIEGQGEDGLDGEEEDGVRRGSTEKPRGGSAAEGMQTLSRQTTRETARSPAQKQQQQEKSQSPRPRLSPTGRSGSIVDAGRGILNRLRSPSAKRNT